MAQYQEGANRLTAMQGLLSMLRLSSRLSIQPNDEDDLAGEADEPPDDLSPMKELPSPLYTSHTYTKTRPPTCDRKESLLTRALMNSPETLAFDHTAAHSLSTKRGLSESSAGSNISANSIADLTSDGGMTSPARTNTPSPPTPSHVTRHHLPTIQFAGKGREPTFKEPAKPSGVKSTDPNESALEANLGRKRCISFACGRKAAEQNTAQKQEQQPPEPPKRKCALTFACATKPSQNTDLKPPRAPRRFASPAPSLHRRTNSQQSGKKPAMPKRTFSDDLEKSEATRFHEFASSNDEDDEWVNNSPVYTNKITLDDCMKKENAIRKIGAEAEEEAMQEEEEEEDDEEDEDLDEHIGFSDSDDDGNESDNEAGFAESDDESDAGSDYQFWTPGLTTAATSIEDVRHIRPASGRRTSETSIDSFTGNHLSHLSHRLSTDARTSSRRIRGQRHHRARPVTPELPDSTDFVCGTLDEDRPLEIAYMSCIEERRRSKHIIIPQDIDPSFPTTDPEDNDDEDEAAEEDDDPEEMEGTYRGRQNNGKGKKVSPNLSPRRLQSPPPKPCRANRSPPPRRLFGQSPKRLRSPPPTRLQSPPCTRRTSLINSPEPRTMNIIGLAQRPNLVHAKSLPRTPNPFFVQYRDRSTHTSAVNSVACSPSNEFLPQEQYTRGPIDIVRGLERKRQKRKEKFWRQHCKKAAKEQQERKPHRGRGAERMKELGLEVAERTKGYGLGKPAELVLSI